MVKDSDVIQEQFNKILYYKWEFLRRNENYVIDCEKWSGRSRKRWSKNEVIIGYRFSGDLAKAFSLPGAGIYSKELLSHYRRYSTIWNNLTTTFEEVKTLQEMGFNPPITPKLGTWYPFKEKWAINLPLNPYCDFTPFFVHIASKDVISEVSGYINNDFILEKGTTSVIRVNWAVPVQYLKLAFENMIEGKRRWLELRNYPLIDHRNQFRLYDDYLLCWDKHNKEKKTIPEIATILFSKEYKKELKHIETFGDLSKANEVFAKLSADDVDLAYEKAYGKETKKGSNKITQRVIDRLSAAKVLIDGGYKEIG